METAAFDFTALINLIFSLILGALGFGQGGWLENLGGLTSLFSAIGG